MNNGKSLLKLSVQDYFSQCNWQGQPLTEGSNGQPTDPASRWTLVVGDYFRLLPWEGTPEVGSFPKPSSSAGTASSSQEEVTLIDLLEAF
ncbi:MAG: hypothetical protein ACRC8Y_25910 [Chroococcales cyanobacterium]